MPALRHSVAAVVCLALALRLAMVFFADGGFAAEDWRLATAIANGEGFRTQLLYGEQVTYTSMKAPGVPYLLALSIKMVPGFPLGWFVVFQAIFGALTCGMLAFLGRKLLGARTGLLAALMLAVFAPHIWWMRHVGQHIFAAAGMVAILLLLYRADEKRSLGAFAAWGAVLGLSAYFSVDVLLPAPLFALWAAWRARGLGWGRALAGPAVAALVAFLVLSPWTIRNYLVHGEFVLVRTGFGTALWVGNNDNATGTDFFLVTDESGTTRPAWVRTEETMPAGLYRELAALPEVAQEKRLVEVAREWIASNPGAAAALWLRKLYYYWWFGPVFNQGEVPVVREFVWGALLLTVGFGVAVARRQRSQRPPFLLMPLAFPLVTSTAIHVTTVVSANWRMRIPIEPILILFAAHAVLELVRSGRLGRWTAAQAERWLAAG